MADRPILFSAPMIRALLAGRKTQTRRVLKPQPEWLERNGMIAAGWSWGPFLAYGTESFKRDAAEYAPIAPGDRLWVRETWRSHQAYDDEAPSEMGGDEPVEYLADGHVETWGWPKMEIPGRTRSSLHIPRWASRLTLTVTDVRVQRLQDITYGDTLAEGIEATDIWQRRQAACLDRNEECGSVCRGSFQELWDSINGDGAWDANPWVAAYSFDVHHCNIDSLGG